MVEEVTPHEANGGNMKVSEDLSVSDEVVFPTKIAAYIDPFPSDETGPLYEIDEDLKAQMANNLREYLDYVFEDCEPSESSEPSKYMDTSLQTSFQEDVLEFDTTERETIRTDTIESFLEETASDLNESFNMETSHDESLPHKTGDKTKTHPITANEEGSYKAQYEGNNLMVVS